MRKSTFFFILVFLLILLANNVTSAPPQVTTSQGAVGLDIRTGQLGHYDKHSQILEFNFHVYNRADGLPVRDNMNCTLQLFNQTGDHIYKHSLNQSNYNTYDWQYPVATQNFTYSGDYGYLFSCNGTVIENIINAGTPAQVTVNRGGFATSEFQVTNAGTEYQLEQTLTYLTIMVVFMFLSCVTLFCAYRIDGNNSFEMGELKLNAKKYLKLGLYFISYLLFTITVFFIWQISYNFLLLQLFTEILRIVWLVMWVAIIPLFFLTLIIGGIKIFLDAKLEKEFKRGVDPRQ